MEHNVQSHPYSLWSVGGGGDGEEGREGGREGGEEGGREGGKKGGTKGDRIYHKIKIL